MSFGNIEGYRYSYLVTSHAARIYRISQGAVHYFYCQCEYTEQPCTSGGDAERICVLLLQLSMI
jgi:hypothetical protein